MDENFNETAGKAVTLASCEKTVKVYKCVKTIDPSGEGVLMLTNKRLIFFINSGKNNRMSAEMPRESFGGINYIYGKLCNKRKRTLAIALLILGAVFAVFSIFKPFIWINAMWRIIFGIFAGLCLIISAFYLLKMFTVSFRMDIKINNPGVSFLSFGNSVFPQDNNSQITITALPSKQTDIMLKELGAVAEDIKNGKYDDFSGEFN